jgi:hypothetical protein
MKTERKLMFLMAWVELLLMAPNLLPPLVSSNGQTAAAAPALMLLLVGMASREEAGSGAVPWDATGSIQAVLEELLLASVVLPLSVPLNLFLLPAGSDVGTSALPSPSGRSSFPSTPGK